MMTRLPPTARGEIYARQAAPRREYRRAIPSQVAELERQGFEVVGASGYALGEVALLLWRPVADEVKP